jgi:hypothetical protein
MGSLLVVLVAALLAPRATGEALRPVVVIASSGKYHLRVCVPDLLPEEQVQSLALKPASSRTFRIPPASWRALTTTSGQMLTCLSFPLSGLGAGRYDSAALVGGEEDRRIEPFARPASRLAPWPLLLATAAGAIAGGLSVGGVWYRARRRATSYRMAESPITGKEEAAHREWEDEQLAPREESDRLPDGTGAAGATSKTWYPAIESRWSSSPAGPDTSPRSGSADGAGSPIGVDLDQAARELGFPATVGSGAGPDRLARAAERWWRSGRSELDELQRITVGQSLQLYEWAEFSIVLKTTIASTVPLRFVRWRPEARGPSFLGCRDPGTSLLHVVPANARAFSSDQGLSALRGLFHLHPEPKGKVFDLVAVRRTCRLRPHGDHYRLETKGELQTDQGPASPYQPPGELAASAPPPPERGGAPDAAGTTLPELQEAIREEIDRFSKKVLDQLKSGFAESQRRHDEVAEVLRALVAENGARPGISPGQPQRFADELLRRLVPGLQAALPSAVPSASALALPAAWAPPADSAMPAPPELRQHPAAESAPPPAGTVAPEQFSWLHRLLDHLDVRETGQAREYLEALRDLQTLVSRQDGAGASQAAYFRVSSEAETSFSLHEVWLEADAEQGMRVRKKDGSWLSPETVWQVFLGVFPAGGGGGPLTPVALVFPWSRLEKGAPVVARSLVDGRRSGALAEFVRCVQPAVLEWRSPESAYVAVNKLVVRPLGASPRS